MRKILFALAVFPILGSVASADEIVKIQNRTSDVIRYNFKWGNTPWRTVTLYPGQVEIHWDQNPSQAPEIDYDPDVNVPGPNCYQMLQAYQVIPGTDGGKVYAFFQTPQNRTVFLSPQN